jgi:hypothetical protein
MTFLSTFSIITYVQTSAPNGAGSGRGYAFPDFAPMRPGRGRGRGSRSRDRGRGRRSRGRGRVGGVGGGSGVENFKRDSDGGLDSGLNPTQFIDHSV